VIFVDTGAWFAAFVPNDVHHAAARGWLDNNTEPLFCTCDDRVLKKAGNQKDLRVRVVSPLQLAEEVSR
jgi:predicted nucleic acid-binding protein